MVEKEVAREMSKGSEKETTKETAEIEEARRVLKIEAQSILDLIPRLNDSFTQAAQMMRNCPGKVIFTGMGKSGQVARKLSSTFSSTGTASLFMHPAESSHGDLGVIGKGDLVVLLSYGGESNELHHVVRFCSRRGVPIIAMTGSPQSTLAKAAQVHLDVSVQEEACPLGLAPTSSSTATLALGDALAMAVLQCRGFTKEEFAEYHPGGKLGRRLLTRVRDVMHSGEALPLVQTSEPLTDVIAAMTGKSVQGVAGVLDNDGNLIGVITDGDIRRRLRRGEGALVGTAGDVMSRHPKTIDADELATKALFVMEQFRIQTLFVLDRSQTYPLKPVGLVHVQDLIRAL